MTRYGYLSQPDPREGKILSSGDITAAVKNLQHMAGLKETGSLEDPATAALVDDKRCAVPDFGPADNAKRKRRYATHGTVWHKKVRWYNSHVTAFFIYTDQIVESEGRAVHKENILSTAEEGELARNFSLLPTI